ncbi:heme ABC transporter ATP-binding protein [Glycomyces harbinensis]|uniref:Iron complex transport system ATP-binding protein n=1 Tax=Glycomyces harbinensis TaxID=58114 RepID=A0A1G6RQS9_9ACTN|nr:heme ABC transporter ATP-binding protein [Glycomyces harbinensis]SDD06979.1 iron complex transport system ATP-binding protein [Glycomyces harbinensis]
MRLRRRHSGDPGPVPDLPAAVSGATVLLGGTAVLRGVDLDVRAGEVLGLVGPNGAGKSTLLAALSGDQAADEGRVSLWGRPVGEWSTVDIARRRAVLPQAHRVSFPFTVRDVVEMGRAPWAGTARRDADDRRIAAALALTEAEPFAQRPFTSLSGGEQARVMLARVVAQDAGLVLLDEPTAALDLRHQEMVGRLCRSLAAEGRAVVIVLHDLDLAAAYCDRTAVLAEGRIVACGPPADVFTADRLTEVYRQPVKVDLDPDTGSPRVTPLRGVPNPGRRSGLLDISHG